jgi:hypothetical protein
MKMRPRLGMALTVAALGLLPAFGPHAAPSSSAPGAERIPFKQDDDDFGATMWRVVLVTAGMALLAVAAVYLMRRQGLMPGTKAGDVDAMRVLQTLRTGPRTSLLVVRFGAQRMLLGQSDQGVRVLASEPAEKP